MENTGISLGKQSHYDNIKSSHQNTNLILVQYFPVFCAACKNGNSNFPILWAK